jgi:hypothetical protein
MAHKVNVGELHFRQPVGSFHGARHTLVCTDAAHVKASTGQDVALLPFCHGLTGILSLNDQEIVGPDDKLDVKRRDKTEIRHANVGLSILVSVTQSQTIHATG